MKRSFVLIVALVLIIIASFFAWRLWGPATAFSGERYFLYIRTGMDYEQVVAELEKDTVLKSPSTFNWLAGRFDYKQNVKAGKYEIKSGMNLIDIIRMLRNGHQIPVHLTIIKLRTREGLASMVGRKFEPDSATVAQFCLNSDSLAQFGVDTNTFMTIIFPNTYSFFWNTSPSAIFKKMYVAYKAWWTPLRRQQAQERGLTPTTAYILASIVEEETNVQADKARIASVYLNRIAQGMRLAADPTVKYALKNFELKRIYEKYTKVESPYNTYRNAGLPPGPICTPSMQTLTAVLESPHTDYLYFVAKPDFSGYSNFAATYKEHLEYAQAYRKALDEQMAIRAKADSLKRMDSAAVKK
jgi:UPF0755 protein